MAVAFRDATNTATGPPFVPSEPASAAEGDFILAYGNINSIDGVWTLPADFTQIDQFSETTGIDSRNFIAYKVRGSDAGSGYSFGYDGTDANCRVVLAAYSGTGLGLDVTYSKVSHYNTTNNDFNAAAKAITTNTDGAMVILAYCATASALDTFGPPSGYTQREAASGTTNVYVCDDTQVTAGTMTPGAFTHTDAIGDQDQRTFTIAISESSGIGRLGGVDNRFNTFIR